MNTRKQIEERIGELIVLENKERLLLSQSKGVCSEHIFPNLVFLHEIEIEKETLKWVLESE